MLNADQIRAIQFDDEPGAADPSTPFPPLRGMSFEVEEGPAEAWGHLVIETEFNSFDSAYNQFFVSREGFKNGEWIHVFEAGYFASEEEAEAWVADHS